MPIPLLAMALGGAALGALSNKKDRKKGALMGLGAGLLGPAIGAMGGVGAAGAAGAGAAGAAAPTLGAQVMGMTKAVAPVALMGAMPKEGPPPPQAGPSMAMQNQGNQPQSNLYNQAMVNQQERMKRRNHTRGMR